MAGAALIQQGVERRKAIFAFIKEYIKVNGYGPSVDEITEGVGVTGKTAIRHHLTNLVEQGVIEMTPGKYRSIRVPDKRRVPK